MNYYIADCHFGHSAIIRFDNRPFGSVEEMEEILIFNWNAVVKPGDTVYILGDMVWGTAQYWLPIVRRLKGQKVLLVGNHDLKQFPPELRKEFADICDYKEIVDNGKNNAGRKVILSHYPMPIYKHDNNHKYYMLHGHVHMTTENDWLELWKAELRAAAASGGDYANLAQIYNVGVMMPYMNYMPRTLDQIIEGYEKWHVS